VIHKIKVAYLVDRDGSDDRCRLLKAPAVDTRTMAGKTSPEDSIAGAMATIERVGGVQDTGVTVADDVGMIVR